MSAAARFGKVAEGGQDAGAGVAQGEDAQALLGGGELAAEGFEELGAEEGVAEERVLAGGVGQVEFEDFRGHSGAGVDAVGVGAVGAEA